MSVRDINATEHTVTARCSRRCEGYRCGQWVKAGEDYVRLVAFPGHDALGYSEGRPWVMRICVACWREYDPERAMPPRRRRRAARCP